MKKWTINLLAILVGFTAAVFLLDNQSLQILFMRVSTMFISLIPYVTYGMLFFLTTAGVASLNLQHLTRKTISYAAVWVIIIVLMVMVTGGFFAYLMPIPDLDAFISSNAPSAGSVSSFEGSSATITAALSGTLFDPFYRSSGLLLPVIGAALVLGYGITPVKEVIRPAYSIMNSFSEVCYTLFNGIGHLMNVGLAFMSGLLLSRLAGIHDWGLLTQFFIFLSLAVLIFILLILPVLLVILTKEKRPYSLIFGLASPILLAFWSGTSSYALPMTLQHIRLNLGIAKRITSVSLPVITLIGRSGSALISCFVLIAFQTELLGATLSAITILMTLLSCILFSLAAYAFPGFEILFICTGTAGMLGLPILDGTLPSFLLILNPLLQGLGAVLDTLIAGLGTAVCGYMLHAHIPVPAKERI